MKTANFSKLCRSSAHNDIKDMFSVLVSDIFLKPKRKHNTYYSYIKAGVMLKGFFGPL